MDSKIALVGVQQDSAARDLGGPIQASKQTRSSGLSEVGAAEPSSGPGAAAPGVAQRAGDWAMTSELSSAMGFGAADPGAQTGAPAQRKATADGGPQRAPSAEAPAGSKALPGEVRAKMETSFSADFSDVRVHEDGAAASMGARAFARGSDLHFAPGEYAPQSGAGQELIGHELAHVVQQREGRVAEPTQAKGPAINADPGLEAEADARGTLAARGEPAHHGAATTTTATGGAATIQAKTVAVMNFDRLAKQIHEAIEGLGTDEAAVYSALTALEHQADNITALKDAYKKYGDLEADIKDDFSGSELTYALSLLTPTAAAAAAAPAPDYAKLAEKIHTAVAGSGTDEEAVYTALSSLEHDPAKIAKLEEAYKTAYQHTLREDLLGDFSGDELKHVLELLGDRSTNEQVVVANDVEAKKAAEIIKQIYVQYGIDVNSQAGVDAIDRDYDEVPREIRDKLRTKAWEYKELVALKAALDRFAPILGDARKDSDRSGEAQEITTVSKVDHAIDENSVDGVLDDTTLGEYFGESTNFSIFTAGTDSTTDFPDNAKQLEGTAIHEIAHGLMKYCLSDFVAKTPYWDSTYLASGKAGVEAPITDYGATNASEDLSETIMYFFVEPATLQAGIGGAAKGVAGNPCPERYDFVDKAVSAWKKNKKGAKP